MAGDTVLRGSQPVEYVEESSFASQEADASWQWFGLVDSWSVDQGVESESLTYLPEHGASNKLEKRVNVKHREMYEGDISLNPQTDFSLLKYWTGTAGGTNDDPPTIQVGEVEEENGEYRRLMGGMGSDVTLSMGEDEAGEISGNFIFADETGWGTSDYVGAGSHATEDTSEPFKWDDVSNVQWGGSSLDGCVESIEVSISNDVAEVRDPDKTRPTQLCALVPVDREITVDITLTYDSFNMLSNIRSYTKQDFTFDIDTTSFTISDVQFPELPYEYASDDLVSDSISSDPASGISWS